MKCPDDKTLCSFIAACLDIGMERDIEEHLRECASCVERLDSFEQANRDLLIQDIKAAKRHEWTAESEDVDIDKIDDGNYLPDTIGSYRVVRFLGSGGMGAVYEGYHPHLKKSVAIKLIRESRASNPIAISRFKREMEAVGKLASPHIVQAFDAGEIDGRLYLVMELLNGSDLAQYINRHGPLTFEQACDIIRQTCQGLHCIHQNGFVHRDIKPSNLWLTEDGNVKILDFGLARLLEEESNMETSHKTKMGTFLGTPDFAAPEQFGDGKADCRSDIYSLGCVFFTLLTARPPFTGKGYTRLIDKIAAHARDNVPSVRLFRKDTPRKIEDLLKKMTEKSPENRFQNISEIKFPCFRYKRTTSHHIYLVLSSIILFAAIFTVVSCFHLLRNFPRISNIETTNNSTNETPPIRKNLQVPAMIDGEASESKNNSKIIQYHPKSMNWVATKTIRVSQGEFNYAFFAQNSRQIISAETAGEVRLWDVETGKELQKFGNKDSLITSFAISPDGKMFACGHENGVVALWDIDARKVIHSYKKEDDFIHTLSFSRNSKKLFSLSTIIDIVDISTKKHEVTFDTIKQRNPFYESHVFQHMPVSSCFSPDGSFVVFSSGIAFLKFNIANKELLRYADVQNERNLSPIILPGNQTSSIILNQNSDCFAIARRFNHVLLCGNENFKNFIEDDELDFKYDLLPKENKDKTEQICSIAFSPSGRYILTGGARAITTLWDYHSGKLVFSFPKIDAAEIVNGLDFSGDGTKILIRTHNDSKISIWQYRDKEGKTGGQ